MNRGEILDEAKRLTTGDRNRTHGEPVNNMTDIAVGWSIILGHKVEPHEVAAMMTWLKICRSKTSPAHADHWIDGAAYMAIAGEVAGVA